MVLQGHLYHVRNTRWPRFLRGRGEVVPAGALQVEGFWQCNSEGISFAPDRATVFLDVTADVHANVDGTRVFVFTKRP